MELLVRVEKSVHKVATRSSTKNRELERKARKDRHRARLRRLDGANNNGSNSSFSLESTMQPGPITPIASVEKGAEENRISKDISREVRKELEGSGQIPDLPIRKVRFDETPVIIQPDLKPDEYDIIQDIKEQKANATIGQPLHDNSNYQKLV